VNGQQTQYLNVDQDAIFIAFFKFKPLNSLQIFLINADLVEIFPDMLLNVFPLLLLTVI